VTVIAPILAGREPALRSLLEDLARDPAVLFARLPYVHFARFFLMDAATDLQGRSLAPHLVFLADVDGPADPFLADLVRFAADGLDRIYAHCEDYPGGAARLDFLRSHQFDAAAIYINTRGRTVSQIKQEAQLRDAIQRFLDSHTDELRGATPRRVRAAILEFVEREPSLQWARHPIPKDPAYLFGESIHFALVASAAIVLFPYILLGLPIWLWLLRRHEKADTPRDITPTDERIQALAAQEDHGVQNPFTSAGFLKPGLFRRFTASVVLFGTNFLTRHVFNHANLIGVKTIHSARWLFVDDKRRVIFASNYDGSLESYMDDFIDKIAWGLNATFSNGVDYPRTNWLILDGAHDEQVFKRFNLMHQLVAPFWYAAYQGLTALNIENNARIRAGLYGDMDDRAAQAWLRRF
jgi:hypothetical protein